MNGYSEIKIQTESGEIKTYPLYFGRQAVEEFGTRLARSLSDNEVKIVADMIYAGHVNYCTKKDLPPNSYPDVYDDVEMFMDQENYQEQYAEVQKEFWESKYGKDYAEKLSEFKKKIEEGILHLQPPATQETSGET